MSKLMIRFMNILKRAFNNLLAASKNIFKKKEEFCICFGPKRAFELDFYKNRPNLYKSKMTNILFQAVAFILLFKFSANQLSNII
jgi:hypothetical protein